MRPTSIVTASLAVLIGVGFAFWLNAGEARRPWPKATPPPPPSPIYTPSTERVPDEAEIADMARGHVGRLEQEIEQALAGRDAQRREAAFTFVLPELVQVDPEGTVAMLARQPEGEARDTLRAEVTRQWIAKDPHAAVLWMKSLPDNERHATAATAVNSIAAYDPAQARALAREFGLKPARN